MMNTRNCTVPPGIRTQQYSQVAAVSNHTPACHDLPHITRTQFLRILQQTHVARIVGVWCAGLHFLVYFPRVALIAVALPGQIILQYLQRQVLYICLVVLCSQRSSLPGTYQTCQETAFLAPLTDLAAIFQ